MISGTDQNHVPGGVRRNGHFARIFPEAKLRLIEALKMVPIILRTSAPVLLNRKYPNIFTPIHVIFLELIMGPTCSVFFENEPVEAGMMQKPPCARSHAIFTWRELLTSILQGVVIAAGILGFYYYFIEKGVGLSYVRTMVFITLIISNVFLTFVNRSFEENN